MFGTYGMKEKLKENIVEELQRKFSIFCCLVLQGKERKEKSRKISFSFFGYTERIIRHSNENERKEKRRGKECCFP